MKLNYSWPFILAQDAKFSKALLALCLILVNIKNGKKNMSSLLNRISRKIPVFSENISKNELISEFKKNDYDFSELIFFNSDDGKFTGYLTLEHIFRMTEDLPLSGLINRDIHTAHPEISPEKLASLSIRYNVTVIPLVDREKKLLGIVTPQKMIEILREEHLEDLHRLAGIKKEIAHVRDTIEEAPLVRVKDRLPWLMFGLLGSMFATYIMSGFENQLEKNLLLAFFVPGIVYLSDAIGTQSETISVRGLSLSNISYKKMFFRELIAGLLIGTILGSMSGLFAFLLFKELKIALIVGLSIMISGTLATGIGSFFPWLLKFFKKDPAYGSGPLATIIQDIISILIYFLIASFFIH